MVFHINLHYGCTLLVSDHAHVKCASTNSQTSHISVFSTGRPQPNGDKLIVFAAHIIRHDYITEKLCASCWLTNVILLTNSPFLLKRIANAAPLLCVPTFKGEPWIIFVGCRSPSSDAEVSAQINKRRFSFSTLNEHSSWKLCWKEEIALCAALSSAICPPPFACLHACGMFLIRFLIIASQRLLLSVIHLLCSGMNDARAIRVLHTADKTSPGDPRTHL